MIVDDLEKIVDELRTRGIVLMAIETVPGVVRRTTITDPDGNTITLGEPLRTGD